MMRCCLFLLLLSACTQTPPLRVPVSLASPHISAPSTPADEAPGVISSPPVSPIVLGLLPQQGALPTPAVSGPIFSQPLPNVLPSSGVLPGFSNGGGGGGSTPQPTPTPRFYIRDVVLTDTGKSVMGENAPAAIQPTYSDPNPIRLSVIGNFDTDLLFSEPAMRFTFEPGLLHQTFAGDTPPVRALLNGVLLLEAVTVTSQRLELLLPQYYLPDLYLQGLHTLTLVSGAASQQVSVMLGKPNIPRATLIPVLSTAIIMPAEGIQPPLLRVEGRHFLLQPGWQQLSLDGTILPIQQVEVTNDGTAVCWAELPPNLTAGNYQLAYQSPFGLTHLSLEISP